MHGLVRVCISYGSLKSRWTLRFPREDHRPHRGAEKVWIGFMSGACEGPGFGAIWLYET